MVTKQTLQELWSEVRDTSGGLSSAKFDEIEANTLKVSDMQPQR